MPLILFDGVCNLCNGAVQFILKRDPARRFQFASLQSPQAQRALARARAGGPATAGPLPDSLVLIDDGNVHVKSTAVLRIARGLRAPWPLAYAGSIVPRAVRDAVYDRVARSRYRWFGRRETCMVPTPDVADRFLDGNAG